MNPSMHRILWIALIAAVTLGLVWQFTPLKDARNRLFALPLKGAGFTGQDLPLTSREEELFQGITVVKREYQIDDQRFFITILDGTHNRNLVHDPYYCFKGSGWEVLNEQQIPLENGTAKLLQLKKGSFAKEALFWFSDGTEIFSAPLKYWWQTTLRRLTLGFSGPEPLLIVVQPYESTSVDWGKFSDTFKALLEI